MAKPIVSGPSYSTYVRTVRLTLAEKSVEYEMVEVAMLQGAHKQPEFLALNPFGRVPAFQHGDLTIYETGAIARYVDRAFPGAALQPAAPAALARVDQVMGIIDSFAYGAMIGKLVWQRVVVPMLGGAGDDSVVEGCLPDVRLALQEFERLLGDDAYFGGAALSLADLHLAPVFAYLTGTSEGAALMPPALAKWWAHMSVRPSMAATAPVFG